MNLFSLSHITRRIPCELNYEVARKDVLIEYIPTEDMIANIPTKPLQGDHRVGLKEQSITAATRSSDGILRLPIVTYAR